MEDLIKQIKKYRLLEEKARTLGLNIGLRDTHIEIYRANTRITSVYSLPTFEAFIEGYKEAVQLDVKAKQELIDTIINSNKDTNKKPRPLFDSKTNNEMASIKVTNELIDRYLLEDLKHL